MAVSSEFWRKELGRRLTILVVPHGTSRPRQFSFSVPFLIFLFTCWTGFTGWASYMASQRLDYWRMKTNSHLLKIKMDYFANQLKNSREMVDEVKEMETQLRTLIGMGSREAIIQTSDAKLKSAKNGAAGGPTAMDMTEVQKALSGELRDMSLQDISGEIYSLRGEIGKRLQGFEEIRNKIDTERRLFRATPNIWPTGGYVTSHFGFRHSPFSGLEDWHQGVDVAGPAGSPIRATADGVVQFSGWGGGYGKMVIINHGYGYSTRYGHNRQALVKKGDRVKRGQIISLMGSTGNATGPHCHYEVWFMGKTVNPRKFLKEGL